MCVCVYIRYINILLLPTADDLVRMLNSALNVSETETIFASCGASTSPPAACEATGCPSLRNHSHPQQSIMGMMQPICHYLTSQLSQLSQLLVNMSYKSTQLLVIFTFRILMLHLLLIRQETIVVLTITVGILSLFFK